VATYYCSDPHAFHRKTMKKARRLAFMTDADREAFLAQEESGGEMRPLRMSDESVDRMNRGLAASINARVGRDDVLWCLGDWASGRGGDYRRNARWFRDQIRCRTVFLVWGNHDERAIQDLFSATYDQVEIRDGDARITLNHYPMLTWNKQRHASLAEPNIHLHGHVHGLYLREPGSSPLKDAAAWPALDVGFDAHDYQVWSLGEILEHLLPNLLACEALRRQGRRAGTRDAVSRGESADHPP
jgi:calcineurin-like phosphoesterase family protein